jgi:hypothetical protein
MRDIIEQHQGTDAELLEILNQKNIKQIPNDGMVTLAMVGSLSVDLAAQVNFTLESVLANLSENTPQEKASKSMLSRFLDRFTISDRGLDLANDTVRTTLTDMLTLGGMDPTSINQLLNLGAFYLSVADLYLRRDATLDDIEAEREVIARDQRQQKWLDVFARLIQPALQQGSSEDLAEAIRLAAEEF